MPLESSSDKVGNGQGSAKEKNLKMLLARRDSLGTSWQYLGILFVVDGDLNMSWKGVRMLLVVKGDPHMPLRDVAMVLPGGGEPHMPRQDDFAEVT